MMGADSSEYCMIFRRMVYFVLTYEAELLSPIIRRPNMQNKPPVSVRRLEVMEQIMEEEEEQALYILFATISKYSGTVGQ